MTEAAQPEVADVSLQPEGQRPRSAIKLSTPYKDELIEYTVTGDKVTYLLRGAGVK